MASTRQIIIPALVTTLTGCVVMTVHALAEGSDLGIRTLLSVMILFIAFGWWLIALPSIGLSLIFGFLPASIIGKWNTRSLLTGAILGLSMAVMVYVFGLRSLIATQQKCDPFCFGLEREALPLIPWWLIYLITVALFGPLQAFVLSKSASRVNTEIGVEQ